MLVFTRFRGTQPQGGREEGRKEGKKEGGAVLYSKQEPNRRRVGKNTPNKNLFFFFFNTWTTPKYMFFFFFTKFIDM